MKNDKSVIITIISMAILFHSCGGERKSTDGPSCSKFLPDEIAQAGIERSSEIRVFKGESLYEYIDGGAEIYHTYGFVEVATANYTFDETEMVIDIYRFDNSDNAYGLFASFRPDNPVFIQLGAEGFSSPTSIDFVKGAFVVRVIAFEESAEAEQAINALASQINNMLPGSDARPARFSFFPRDAVIEATDRIYAQSFLGHKFLTDVYSRDYRIDNDTLTLFLSEDEGEEKFILWFELGVADGSAEPGPDDLLFDDGKVFVLENSYYGKIAAGLNGDNLLGMINYSDDYKDLLNGWLDSMY